MWEAAMLGGHRKLEKLTVIVDRNRLQQGARTEDTNALEPLADKWRAFGWEVAEIDGHDHRALLAILEKPPAGRPRCVIANTFKGFGISYMLDQASWHHGVPDAQQYAQALEELAFPEQEA
jgi:transketolase